jgi:2-methylisocitrate lyase-like PEP mutase family enzyme
MTSPSTQEKATRLLELHRAPTILTLVNVWDVASARVVAGMPGIQALATASHSIAASLGYEDGEHIPVEEMIAAVGRIVAATDLPVTADLEAGYGDPAGTIRRAIGMGVVGANLEDQVKPLPDAVAAVEAAVQAALAEGVGDFVLNARTDAFLRAGDRDPAAVLDDAITRGRAFLDAGAPVVFIPGLLDEAQVATLVDALGPQRLSLLAMPGALSVTRMEELGVARVSFGPWSQRAALTALRHLTDRVLRGSGVPDGIEPLT